MKIKFNKLHPKAKCPVRSNSTDAGADLYSVDDVEIQPLSRAIIGTGIAIEMPDITIYGRIAPRSGLALKHGIDVLAGVIDKGYRGEIKVILYNTDKDRAYRISQGDKIAQIIFEKFEPLNFIETDHNLSESSRGSNGFGSTGNA